MNYMKILYVKWLDINSKADMEWEAFKDLEELRPAVIHSVGFLETENEEFIVLHMARDNDVKDGGCFGRVAIPRGVIEEIEELACMGIIDG
jgi:hypothetical protein